MLELDYFPSSLLKDYKAKSFGSSLQSLEELPLFPVFEDHKYSCEFRF